MRRNIIAAGFVLLGVIAAQVYGQSNLGRAVGNTAAGAANTAGNAANGAVNAASNTAGGAANSANNAVNGKQLQRSRQPA